MRLCSAIGHLSDLGLPPESSGRSAGCNRGRWRARQVCLRVISVAAENGFKSGCSETAARVTRDVRDVPVVMVSGLQSY